MPAATAPTQPVKIKNADRRTLRFEQLEDIRNEAQRLVQPGTNQSGNWTAPQAIEHIARTIDWSVNGFPFSLPLHFRLLGRLIRNSSLKKTLPSGFKGPAHVRALAEADASITAEQALTNLDQALAQAQRPGSMKHASPAIGELTHDEWIALHCRHAELHFSFFHPQA